jgi:hypothetical protein
MASLALPLWAALDTRSSSSSQIRAANLANKDAWRLSGVVSTVRWYTAEDDNVCEFCQAQDGKEIGIDDNFYSSGDEIEGVNGKVTTADYGDVEAPYAC